MATKTTAPKASKTQTNGFDVSSILAAAKKHAPKHQATARSNSEYEEMNQLFPMVRGQFWDAQRPRLSGEKLVEAKRLGLEIETGRSRYPRAGGILARMSSAFEHNKLMQFPSIYVSVPALLEDGTPNEAGMQKISEYYDRLHITTAGYEDADGNPVTPYEFTEISIYKQVKDDNGFVYNQDGSIQTKLAYGAHPDIRDQDGNMKSVLLYGFYIKSRRKSDTAHAAEVRFMEANP